MAEDFSSLPQSTHNRCGCDCKNQTTFAVCDGRDLNVCCTHCASGAPSAYGIAWECFRHSGAANHPPLEFIWRDCPFECKWVSRGLGGWTVTNPNTGLPCQPCTTYNTNLFWCVHPEINLFTPFNSVGWPCDDEDCDPFSSMRYYCEFGSGNTCNKMPRGYFPPVYEDVAGTYPSDYVETGDYHWSGPLPFKCCYPGPFFCGTSSGTSEACEDSTLDGWFDYYGQGFPDQEMTFSNLDPNVCSPTRAQFIQNCMAVATELEITGANSATLTVIGDPDNLIYVCNDFECLERSTFHLTNRTDTPGVDRFPDHVCVFPAVGNYRTPCSSPASACDCKDSGWSTVSLTIGPNECNVPETVGLTRNATLPACVPDPGGPCGYFYGEVVFADCHGDPQKLGFILHCPGSTPYELKIYCFDQNPGSTPGPGCTEICSTTTSEVSFCPDGELFTWSCGDFGDCCPDCALVTPACCPDGVASVLNVTFSGIASDSFSITFDPSLSVNGAWEGTFTTLVLGMPSAICTTVFRLTCVGIIAGFARYNIAISNLATDPDPPCTGCSANNLNGTATSCNPFLLTRTMNIASGCVFAPGGGALGVTITN